MERNPIFKHLHFDVIKDHILPTLPARSLVRFTSACKTWYNVIKSQQFITAHLNGSLSNSSGHQVLILGENLYYVLANQILSEHVRLDFFLFLPMYWYNPMRLCNGLLFITATIGHDTEYLLWNPSIKKSKKLESKFDGRYYEECDMLMYNYEIFGLGFHELSSDHRVVRIFYVIDDSLSGIGHVPTQVDVYSLSKDSWHKVDSSPGRLIASYGGVFVNGAIHWLATTRFTKLREYSSDNDHFESILYFDLEDECFKEMELPEELQFTDDGMVDFNEFKGSLAAVVYKATMYSSWTFLWVMTDYGVTESWTKRFSITKDSLVSSWRPVGLLRNGILVRRDNQDGKKIVFFDVDSGQGQDVHGLLECEAVVDFMENLVLFQV